MINAIKMTHTKKVSVIVLSFNRPKYLKQAIDSIVTQSYQNLEIIVVDNKSQSSQQISDLMRGFDQVHFISNQSNLGFPAGMNIGLNQSKGDYVYFTEDDIVLDRDCIFCLVKAAEENSNTGLIAPIVYNLKSKTIRCAGGEVSLGGMLKLLIYGADQEDQGQYSQPMSVTFVAGASMFGNREYLKTIGGFREDFFLYVEDIEICMRILSTGKKIKVMPQAKVYHFEPENVMGSPPFLIQFHKLKNCIALYILHGPVNTIPEFLIRHIIFIIRNGSYPIYTNVWMLFRVLAWALIRLPVLILDRNQGLKSLK